MPSCLFGLSWKLAPVALQSWLMMLRNINLKWMFKAKAVIIGLSTIHLKSWLQQHFMCILSLETPMMTWHGWGILATQLHKAELEWCAAFQSCFCYLVERIWMVIVLLDECREKMTNACAIEVAGCNDICNVVCMILNITRHHAILYYSIPLPVSFQIFSALYKWMYECTQRHTSYLQSMLYHKHI